jgi:cupin 2 domain-containing protein
MDKISFYNDIPKLSKDEIFFKILSNEKVRIEKIVSNGQKSAKNFWYDQSENEFVMVLKGHAFLEFEDEVIELNPGDAVNIPARKKHRVKYTSTAEPTVWIAVFY